MLRHEIDASLLVAPRFGVVDLARSLWLVIFVCAWNGEIPFCDRLGLLLVELTESVLHRVEYSFEFVEMVGACWWAVPVTVDIPLGRARRQ